ncbi:unnamed protein product [Hymenolepis diminuta]|uniref:Uncharacterized protein n=1 Tax=Hymenolepis diminuta TaxID=6216 RepID=A0A564XU25_HYMDI|nr:unnamed protein product [Hymenolepis diminuta]
MSKRVHRFPFLSKTASLHIKVTSALMFWRGLTQVTRIKLPLFSRQMTRLSVTGSYAALSLPLPSLCYSLWSP